MRLSFIVQTIFGAFASLFLISCKSESPDLFFLQGEPIKGTTPVHTADDALWGCGAPLFPADSNAIYCAIFQGESFPLSDSSKYWLPQYAFDLGTVFTYVNGDGATLELILTEKDHVLVDRIATSEPCNDSTNKLIGTCHEVELFYVILETEAKDVSLYVEVGSTQIWSPDTTFNPQGQIFLQPLHTDELNNQLIWPQELDETGFLYQLFPFRDQLTISGQSHENVLSRNDWYYSKEVGLIGFRDEKGVLWVLQQ